MDCILEMGTAHAAPVILIGSDRTSWSGKGHGEMSSQEVADLVAFCMSDARRLGKMDAHAGRPERSNPFHTQYLRGMPAMYFRTFYLLGRQEGLEEAQPLRSGMSNFELAYG